MDIENKIEVFEHTLLKLLVRRGTEYDRRNIVLSNGELGYTTDKKRLWVGDGVTQGGNVVGNATWIIATYTDLITDAISFVECGDVVYVEDIRASYQLKSNKSGASYSDWALVSTAGLGIFPNQSALQSLNSDEFGLISNSGHIKYTFIPTKGLNLEVTSIPASAIPVNNPLVVSNNKLGIKLTTNFKLTNGKLDIKSVPTSAISFDSPLYKNGSKLDVKLAQPLNVDVSGALTLDFDAPLYKNGSKLDVKLAQPLNVDDYGSLNLDFDAPLYKNTSNKLDVNTETPIVVNPSGLLTLDFDAPLYKNGSKLDVGTETPIVVNSSGLLTIDFDAPLYKNISNKLDVKLSPPLKVADDGSLTLAYNSGMFTVTNNELTLKSLPSTSGTPATLYVNEPLYFETVSGNLDIRYDSNTIVKNGSNQLSVGTVKVDNINIDKTLNFNGNDITGVNSLTASSVKTDKIESTATTTTLELPTKMKIGGGTYTWPATIPTPTDKQTVLTTDDTGNLSWKAIEEDQSIYEKVGIGAVYDIINTDYYDADTYYSRPSGGGSPTTGWTKITDFRKDGIIRVTFTSCGGHPGRLGAYYYQVNKGDPEPPYPNEFKFDETTHTITTPVRLFYNLRANSNNLGSGGSAATIKIDLKFKSPGMCLFYKAFGDKYLYLSVGLENDNYPISPSEYLACVTSPGYNFDVLGVPEIKYTPGGLDGSDLGYVMPGYGKVDMPSAMVQYVEIVGTPQIFNGGGGGYKTNGDNEQFMGSASFFGGAPAPGAGCPVGGTGTNDFYAGARGTGAIFYEWFA